jgi:hypothetical protein
MYSVKKFNDASMMTSKQQDQACLIYISLKNAVLLVPAVIIELNRKREGEKGRV